MNFYGFTKIRLADEEGLNGETAWAKGYRKERTNAVPANLYLILDNETSYFPAGTELILQNDGYNVDMVATKELYDARKLIDKYHSWTAEESITTKLVKKLLDRHNLSQFLGAEITTSNGSYKLEEIVEDNNQVAIKGVEMTNSEVKKYSDQEWLKAKVGFEENDDRFW